MFNLLTIKNSKSNRFSINFFIKTLLRTLTSLEKKKTKNVVLINKNKDNCTLHLFITKIAGFVMKKIVLLNFNNLTRASALKLKWHRTSEKLRFDANLRSRSRNLNRLSLHISFHSPSPVYFRIASYYPWLHSYSRSDWSSPIFLPPIPYRVHIPRPTRLIFNLIS